VRNSRIITPFLYAVLLSSIIGCGGGEATSPEGQEIEHFLQDKSVNSVLWEEWNIFDEYSLALSIYENSAKLPTDYAAYHSQRNALKDRVAENYADIASISPPISLNRFWAMISDAMKHFNDSYESFVPFSTSMINNGVTINAEAWLSLSNTCRQYDIQMGWPLPRGP
jgi:hypothetical protein